MPLLGAAIDSGAERSIAVTGRPGRTIGSGFIPVCGSGVRTPPQKRQISGT